MAGNVTKDFFSIGGSYTGVGGGTIGTFVVPKGAKAVITSLVVNTVSTLIGADGTIATLTASGGQTGVIATGGVGGAAIPTQSFIQSAGGKAISEVIDASSAAVTLTLTVAAQAANEGSASVVGKFIS